MTHVPRIFPENSGYISLLNSDSVPMYSRSERKLTQLQNATSGLTHLGPGCYYFNDDTGPDFQGKKSLGYAPFLSLSERVSAFDEFVKPGPSPGAYNLESALHFVKRQEKALPFGKSKVERFIDPPVFTPGPAAYNVQIPKEGLQGEFVSRIKEFKRVVDSSKYTIAINSENGRGAILFKRKVTPPSIPTGIQTFGYEETEVGELIPRPPPRIQLDSSKYTLGKSFVDDARRFKRGTSFGQGAIKRVFFKGRDGPGPASYNVILNNTSKRKGITVSTAFTPRYSEQIITDAKRLGVPGPGAYESGEPKFISRKMNQPGFGSGVSRFEGKVVDGPGPGSYKDPRHAIASKQSFRIKPQSFSTTSDRFSEPTEVKLLPGPGAYNVEEVTDLSKIGLKRITQLTSRNPYIAFGSCGERFAPKKTEEETGEYEIEARLRDKRMEKARQKKLAKAARKTSVFVSHSERFSHVQDEDAPPPGSYDIMTSFISVKDHGKIKTGSIHKPFLTDGRLKNFVHSEENPGPGQYDQPPSIPNYIAPKRVFVTKTPRFLEKQEDTPGPGSYKLAATKAVKKSFNVTYSNNEE